MMSDFDPLSTALVLIDLQHGIVGSTARQAWELGHEVVLAEDACAGSNADLHAMAINHIFPRIARVMTCADIKLSA